MKAGQGAALQVQYWHDFLRCVSLAGYRTSKMISSEASLIFAYGFYLIGRTQFGVEEHALRKAIAQWLFMSSVSGRFTSSPESKMEFDLARLRNVSTSNEFLAVIDDICSSTMTSDLSGSRRDRTLLHRRINETARHQSGRSWSGRTTSWPEQGDGRDSLDWAIVWTANRQGAVVRS